MAPQGFQDMLAFGLIEALLGRRSRRVFMGAEIPDGVFAFKSRHPPVPLSELETLLVVGACGANTSWHHLITVMHLQAHHLDLEFYDTFYKPGAYLRTHAEHMRRWHEV
jgi:hypothetical protein